MDVHGDDGFQPVKSADRTLEVLERLGDSPSKRTLGELARELSIPKSSLHGILRTMARRGWVEADATGTRFGLGLRALRVGTTYIQRDDIISRIQPVLEHLSSVVGETTHLGRLDGTDIVYLAKLESRHPIRLYSAIGSRLPAHATALGKALLAQRSEEEILSLLPETLSALTSHTLTTRDLLLEELHRIRDAGFSVDHEENSDGIQCYAVALKSSTPLASVDAVSISIPMFRLTPEMEEQAIGVLLEVNDRLDRQL